MVDQTSQFVKSFWNQAQAYERSQPSNNQSVLGQQPAPQPYAPPPIAPEIQPCPECGYNPSPAQGQVLRAQESEIEQEISNEQNQELVQRIVQQQRQIDQLIAQGQQNPANRNIPQELQRKQALLSQVENEIQGHPSGGQGLSPTLPQGGLAPDTGYVSQPVELVPQGGQVFVQRETTENPPPGAPGSVKFCVQCASLNDSHLFLNGEPAACSVIPS